jgi:two-component system, OmpR family, alkaline phosphatase synthesis response regulator PhoP
MFRATYPSALNTDEMSGSAVHREGAITRSMDTVLVVEDSQAMQRALRRLFEADSLQVEVASDGPTGLELFRKQLPCAVVLDLKLPGISGKELCREFKALAATVPIVVLSANSEVDDKVLLLELGADDYVTKPFSPKELLARVRRAMRRTGTTPPIVTQVPSKPFHHEVPREELLNEVWGYQNYPSTRTVDNYVLRLRQKLEPDPAAPRFLMTMHRAGYKFTPGGSATGSNS